jgi:hypothetical protein
MDKSEKLLRRFFETEVAKEKQDASISANISDATHSQNNYWWHIAAMLLLLISLLSSLEIIFAQKTSAFAETITKNSEQGYYSEITNELYNVLLISQKGE